MSRNKRLKRAVVSAVFLSCVPRVILADAVTIDTSAIAGQSGQLTFDFTNNNPGDGNHVSILNFSAPGATLGLPTTQGGLVSGDLILGLNPAPFTQIDGDFFFNELNVTFTSFANLVTFTVGVSSIPPPSGVPPAEFAFFMLDASGSPLFPTADPSGADALFTIDVTGAPGGVRNIYSPAMLTSANNIDIVVPGGVASVPEPSSRSLLVLVLAIVAIHCVRRNGLKNETRVL
jgi:hypothetical protein